MTPAAFRARAGELLERLAVTDEGRVIVGAVRWWQRAVAEGRDGEGGSVRG